MMFLLVMPAKILTGCVNTCTNLCPLCRTREGRPARVFFDVGEHGIQVGQDFQTAIDQAIERTHKFLPVYSRYYFNKAMCRLELTHGPLQRDASF